MAGEWRGRRGNHARETRVLVVLPCLHSRRPGASLRTLLPLPTLPGGPQLPRFNSQCVLFSGCWIEEKAAGEALCPCPELSALQCLAACCRCMCSRGINLFRVSLCPAGTGLFVGVGLWPDEAGGSRAGWEDGVGKANVRVKKGETWGSPEASGGDRARGSLVEIGCWQGVKPSSSSPAHKAVLHHSLPCNQVGHVTELWPRGVCGHMCYFQTWAPKTPACPSVCCHPSTGLMQTSQ